MTPDKDTEGLPVVAWAAHFQAKYKRGQIADVSIDPERANRWRNLGCQVHDLTYKAVADQTIASLRAENKRLENETRVMHRLMESGLAELEQARADAERYRFLRDKAINASPFNKNGHMVWAVIGLSAEEHHPADGEELDRAIDAARQPEQEGGKV